MTVILSRSRRPWKAFEGGEGPVKLSPEISAPAANHTKHKVWQSKLLHNHEIAHAHHKITVYIYILIYISIGSEHFLAL
jgi:hypothetical protein